MNIAGIDRSPLLKHYGNNKYIPEKVMPVKNGKWVKPKIGGLWTSPIDSIFGWKDWNQTEQFAECDDRNSFTLRLSDNAKILIIDSLEDLLQAPLIDCECLRNKFLDFEKIATEYDGIWLTEQGQRKTRLSRPANLYGWDCETVLVLNGKCCYQI
jgi:hypothetical protein